MAGKVSLEQSWFHQSRNSTEVKKAKDRIKSQGGAPHPKNPNKQVYYCKTAIYSTVKMTAALPAQIHCHEPGNNLECPLQVPRSEELPLSRSLCVKTAISTQEYASAGFPPPQEPGDWTRRWVQGE